MGFSGVDSARFEMLSVEIGEVILSSDLEGEVELLRQKHRENYRIFAPTKKEKKDSPNSKKKKGEGEKKSDFNFEGTFKIEDARDAIYEARISSETQKYIILAASDFTFEAQNALLKVLEEPPKNTKFYLLTKRKNSLLDTALSRLSVQNHIKKLPREDFELDLRALDLSAIVEYTKKPEFLAREATDEATKEGARKKIESLFFATKKAGIRLSAAELAQFARAMEQVERGGSAKFIMLSLLLLVLENKRKKSGFSTR